MNVLSYLHGIIIDHAISAPYHWKNVMNATDRSYLKEKNELIGELGSNDTTKIGMLHIASKDVSIKCLDQCINILNNK